MSDARTLTMPTIHSNGTSREELHRGYRSAHSAVLTAMSRVGDSWPIGRDYYTRGPDVINQAIKEHRSRLERLDSVLQELESLCIHTMEPRHD